MIQKRTARAGESASCTPNLRSDFAARAPSTSAVALPTDNIVNFRAGPAATNGMWNRVTFINFRARPSTSAAPRRLASRPRPPIERA
ncbi:MAG TPA: hypothetical protein VK614_09260 [Allosphingosinicella sp.]|nr:hypothetical protein [Allosphingosinicella sp.]